MGSGESVHVPVNQNPITSVDDLKENILSAYHEFQVHYPQTDDFEQLQSTKLGIIHEDQGAISKDLDLYKSLISDAQKMEQPFMDHVGAVQGLVDDLKFAFQDMVLKLNNLTGIVIPGENASAFAQANGMNASKTLLDSSGFRDWLIQSILPVGRQLAALAKVQHSMGGKHEVHRDAEFIHMPDFQKFFEDFGQFKVQMQPNVFEDPNTEIETARLALMKLSADESTAKDAATVAATKVAGLASQLTKELQGQSIYQQFNTFRATCGKIDAVHRFERFVGEPRPNHEDDAGVKEATVEFVKTKAEFLNVQADHRGLLDKCHVQTLYSAPMMKSGAVGLDVVGRDLGYAGVLGSLFHRPHRIKDFF